MNFIPHQKINEIDFFYKKNRIEIICDNDKIEEAIYLINTKKKKINIDENFLIYYKFIKLNFLFIKILSFLRFNKIKLVIYTKLNIVNELKKSAIVLINNDEANFGKISKKNYYDFYYENKDFKNFKFSEIYNENFIFISTYKVNNIFIEKSDNGKIRITSSTKEYYQLIEIWSHYTENINESFTSFLYLTPDKGRYNISYYNKEELIDLVEKNLNENLLIEIIYSDYEYAIKEFSKWIFVEFNNKTYEESYKESLKINKL